MGPFHLGLEFGQRRSSLATPYGQYVDLHQDLEMIISARRFKTACMMVNLDGVPLASDPSMQDWIGAARTHFIGWFFFECFTVFGASFFLCGEGVLLMDHECVIYWVDETNKKSNSFCIFFFFFFGLNFFEKLVDL